MSQDKLDCYIVPSAPLSLLLPIECIAEVIAKPEVQALAEAPANWMKGHVNWHNQRLPVLSYSALHDPELDESKKRKSRLVVLNPIPNAVRKAYSGLLCYGDVEQVTVDASMVFAELPSGVDRRYVEAVIKLGKKTLLFRNCPRLVLLFHTFSQATQNSNKKQIKLTQASILQSIFIR